MTVIVVNLDRGRHLVDVYFFRVKLMPIRHVTGPFLPLNHRPHISVHKVSRILHTSPYPTSALLGVLGNIPRTLGQMVLWQVFLDRTRTYCDKTTFSSLIVGCSGTGKKYTGNSQKALPFYENVIFLSIR